MCDDTDFLATHPGTVAIVRPIAEGEHPDYLASECLLFVAPWLGGWHKEIVPFAPPKKPEPWIALTVENARGWLAFARMAQPGDDPVEVAERLLAECLRIGSTEETA